MSALDVSIQSQILNLLLDLRREFDLTYLFISHNLSVVEYFSDRVAVMYLGQIHELATVDQLYHEPRHPYTVALLSAIPRADPRVRRRLVLKGDLPSPAAPPTGCRFHTRCWLREKLGNPENCVTVDPELRDLGDGHRVKCHWSEEVTPATIQTAAQQQSRTATAVGGGTTSSMNPAGAPAGASSPERSVRATAPGLTAAVRRLHLSERRRGPCPAGRSSAATPRNGCPSPPDRRRRSRPVAASAVTRRRRRGSRPLRPPAARPGLADPNRSSTGTDRLAVVCDNGRRQAARTWQPPPDNQDLVPMLDLGGGLA